MRLTNRQEYCNIHHMNNIPSKCFTRNEYGLLDLDYVFNDDGYINWRSMVATKYLYVNPSLNKRKKIETKYQKNYKDINVVTDNVDDSDLVLLLAGYKQILRIRGFNKVDYIIKASNENYASVTCGIEFFPSFETAMRTVMYADNACAHHENCRGFGQKYLVEMASNRAFCRCIGSFLNINLLSVEELSIDIDEEFTEESAAPSPQIYELLDKALKSKNKTFETLKDRLIKEDFPGADKITKLEEIPQEKAFYFLETLKK